MPPSPRREGAGSCSRHILGRAVSFVHLHAHRPTQRREERNPAVKQAKGTARACGRSSSGLGAPARSFHVLQREEEALIPTARRRASQESADTAAVGKAASQLFQVKKLPPRDNFYQRDRPLPTAPPCLRTETLAGSPQALHAALGHLESHQKPSLRARVPRSSAPTRSVNHKRAQALETSSGKVVCSVIHRHVNALHVHSGSDT